MVVRPGRQAPSAASPARSPLATRSWTHLCTCLRLSPELRTEQVRRAARQAVRDARAHGQGRLHVGRLASALPEAPHPRLPHHQDIQARRPVAARCARLRAMYPAPPCRPSPAPPPSPRPLDRAAHRPPPPTPRAGTGSSTRTRTTWATATLPPLSPSSRRRCPRASW